MVKNVRLEVVRSSVFGGFDLSLAHFRLNYVRSSGFLEGFSRFKVWQLILGRISGCSKIDLLKLYKFLLYKDIRQLNVYFFYYQTLSKKIWPCVCSLMRKT